jgi:hypothetical protein
LLEVTEGIFGLAGEGGQMERLGRELELTCEPGFGSRPLAGTGIGV